MKIDDFQSLTQLDWSRTEEDHRKMVALLRERGFDPGNFYQELEMSSPYVNTHRDVSYYHVPVNLHSHNYTEIIYCRNCENMEYLVESDRYRIQRGDILLIPPGVSHRPIMPENLTAPYERDVLWISQEFMELVTSLFREEHAMSLDFKKPIRTANTHWEFLGDLFRRGVLEEEAKRPGWDAVVAGNTLTILAHMKRAYMERSAGTMRAENPELLDRITAYIEQNYAAHITVDELAKRFYVSNSTISHLFKHRMGISLYRYITRAG